MVIDSVESLTPLTSPWSAKYHDPYLDCLAEYGIRRSYKAGSVLFYEGEVENNIFYMLSGKVKLTMSYPHGSELLLSINEGKSVIGAVALNGMPNYATAIALLNSEVFTVSVHRVKELINKDPQVGWGIMNYLIAENRSLAGQVSCIALTDASARVIKLLSIISKTTDHKRKNYLNCTHLEIANAIGLSRSLVTCILNRLESAGVIKKTRAQIIIVDPDRLEKLFNSKENTRDKLVDFVGECPRGISKA